MHLKKLFISLFAVLLAVNFSISAQNDSKEKSEKRPEGFTNTQFHQAYLPSYKSDAKPLRVKNIILLIGDGMGLAHLTGGMYANKNELSVCNFKTIGLCKTYAANNITTDSAASGTALATGEKTNNGCIGVNSELHAIANITEIVSKKGMTTGVVTTDKITGATPSSFYAHQKNRKMSEEIFGDLAKSKLDFFLGGNMEYAKAMKADVLRELKVAGFEIIDNVAQVATMDRMARVGVLPTAQEFKTRMEGRADVLPAGTKAAINFLNNKKRGFFLMVEAAQIDFGGHRNDTEIAVREMVDFDRAITEALRFADEDGETLVIVTADHETGGFALLGGNKTEGTVKGRFASGSHTPIMVPLFAYGPQSDRFGGVMENTDVQKRILEVLK